MTWFRLARPLLSAGPGPAWFCYLIRTPMVAGGGLGFALALAALGVLLGLRFWLILQASEPGLRLLGHRVILGVRVAGGWPAGTGPRSAAGGCWRRATGEPLGVRRGVIGA